MALQEQDKRMFLSYNFFGGGHNIDVVFICVIVSFIFAHLVTGQGESLKCPILQKIVAVVSLRVASSGTNFKRINTSETMKHKRCASSCVSSFLYC